MQVVVQPPAGKRGPHSSTRRLTHAKICSNLRLIARHTPAKCGRRTKHCPAFCGRTGGGVQLNAVGTDTHLSSILRLRAQTIPAKCGQNTQHGPAFCGRTRQRVQQNEVPRKKKKNFLHNAYNNHVTFARKTIEAIESYRLSKTNCSVRPYEYPVRGVCFDEYTRRRLYLDE